MSAFAIPSAKNPRHHRPDPSGVDLRRKPSRDLAESLVARAEHLAPGDAQLVLAVYRDDTPVKSLAALLRTPTPALRRRIRRLVARVADPEFAFVAAHLAGWPPTLRVVARACVLHGLTYRAAARELGLSLHSVRRQRDAARALFEAQAPRPAARRA